MRNLLFFLFISFISFNSQIFSQTLSPDFIRSVKVSSLSNEEIIKIKSEMDKQSMTMATLENLAISNGMSAVDFSVLKTRLDGLSSNVSETNVEKGTIISEKPIELDAKSDIKKSDIYGSEIFNSTTLSFEPNANMATPANYILGAGDELQIVVYGIQEFASSAQVSKEGRITLPVVGQIFVNGLTFEAARIQIKKACGKIYSSLNSGQSSLSVSLSKIRTIKITIIGAKKSGNYSVSSLSTVFNALHIAGGPEANGSYRNIELLRNNKVIRKIDIYKFLVKGDQSDNLNLLENDVIRIPVYENRVKIEGNVKRPGIFEMLPNETFSDLMNYCGGFDEAAYRKNIKLIQNSDRGLKVLDLTEDKYNSYIIRTGDVFKVSQLLNKLENKLAIKGSVNRPDDYEFVEGMTILDLINKADGLTNDAYRNRALLIRVKEDLTNEITNVDLNTVFNGSNNFVLRKNDELIISSLFDFKNQQTLNIFGYVKNEGEYPFIENITLYDLIIQSGGFTNGASKVVEVSRTIIKDEKILDQKESSTIISLEIDTLLMDQSKNVKLAPYDIVSIRKKPVFELQQSVSIIGEALYPGAYTISKKDETFLDILTRAGGLKSNANTNAIYILRKVDLNSTEKKESNIKKIPIDYLNVIKNPTKTRNIVIKPGDQIVINKLDNTVKVFGNVYLNSEIPYVGGKNLKYYLSSVGGLNENSDKKRIYIVKANGLAKATKTFLGFRKYPKVEAGCEIFVPQKIEKINTNKLTTSELAIISSAIGSITATIIAITTLTK